MLELEFKLTGLEHNFRKAKIASLAHYQPQLQYITGTWHPLMGAGGEAGRESVCVLQYWMEGWIDG